MTTTKSGLTIHTIELEQNGVLQMLAHEHSWLVRFTHWPGHLLMVAPARLVQFLFDVDRLERDPDYLTIHSSGRG